MVRTARKTKLGRRLAIAALLLDRRRRLPDGWAAARMASLACRRFDDGMSRPVQEKVRSLPGISADRLGILAFGADGGARWRPVLPNRTRRGLTTCRIRREQPASSRLRKRYLRQRRVRTRAKSPFQFPSRSLAKVSSWSRIRRNWSTTATPQNRHQSRAWNRHRKSRRFRINRHFPSPTATAHAACSTW